MTATTETDIGRALGTDYFLLRSELTEDEADYLDRTRRFVDREVLPVIPVTGSVPSCRWIWLAGWGSWGWWGTGSKATAARR